jgi:iron-sulfur cluster assembly protein
MALDEPKENDSVFDVEGFQYLVDKDLFEKANPIKVDFLQVGFKIDSNLNFGAAAESGSGCEGCSCS